MAKTELGRKHLCQKCGAKFYDLARAPAACPSCGAVVKGGARPAARRAPADETPAEKAVAESAPAAADEPPEKDAAA